jgi:hypothetical protein
VEEERNWGAGDEEIGGRWGGVVRCGGNRCADRGNSGLEREGALVVRAGTTGVEEGRPHGGEVSVKKFPITEGTPSESRIIREARFEIRGSHTSRVTALPSSSLHHNSTVFAYRRT